MMLEPLLSLKNLKEGDIFTFIDSNNEDNILQFLCRDINISSNSPYYNKVGYFVEVYDKHRVFRITEDSLKDFRIWVGYDEKFALEERIKTLQDQLKTLQDRLARLKEMKSEKA